jgi:transposase
MDKELHTNAVRLSPKEQYRIRKDIIRLSKAGRRPAEIAQILDVSLRHVFNTRKAYKDGGHAAIAPKHRGRRHGQKRILSPEQERVIRELITEKTPEQLRIPGCLWTRENIRELIRQVCEVTLGLSTLGYYLARWGFSVQRPKKRA